ncbi:MAG: nicotinate-nucleotide--dimethylbenzimidazole phosphoribosyltransferase [Omnitrophica WOR_2 bacterium RIFCSPLOWO2_02_FULL_63_16]|nr:MAG: nicotinate-nucleotide--dimethylbenzimidazole phosphoribosyltransferase [Omnitrophica WOR_2 bacterium GWA2_63_20]OGX45662.1 MAG: nicotinate-nucleotide--dimethylbenzimidazole phosphoribosyltransferase [Omnitrophica WOR_2 bacterium RIFCSPLOWO2_02_FULL_63_16]OGX49665.1 MAG: nicotinate-nucleotide--dimethylbenzimidazole phosphoribosyltransferase [Omnitrophica WOR_2 bacterium RIFCSPLOWO2_12_FULL_63_16]
MPLTDAPFVRIEPVNEDAEASAQQRLNRLTKPPGSLGRLEDIATQLAGILGTASPSIGGKAIITMAADHGIADEGVSAYPKVVTPQMVLNFLRGGAAINVLARLVGAQMIVVDMGVAADLPAHPKLVSRKIGYGTKNMAVGPAMTRAEAHAAIQAGLEIVGEAIGRGATVIGTGDMGIGNTTASSALVAAMTQQDPQVVTGRGTGVDEATYRKKVAVIQRALAINRPDPADPLEVLAKVGGFEIAGLVGVILGGAQARKPVVIDGFISGASALIASAVEPRVNAYLIAAHRSQEPGHRIVLERLGLRPLLELDMRLGEGTGAALAMPILEAACHILNDMATFDEAGVSERP